MDVVGTALVQAVADGRPSALGTFASSLCQHHDPWFRCFLQLKLFLDSRNVCSSLTIFHVTPLNARLEKLDEQSTHSISNVRLCARQSQEWNGASWSNVESPKLLPQLDDAKTTRHPGPECFLTEGKTSAAGESGSAALKPRDSATQSFVLCVLKLHASN